MLVLAIALVVQVGDTLRIVDRPCGACALSIDTVAVLGDDDGPGMIRGSQVVVSRDASGRYLVGGATSAGTIAVFDSAGRFLRSVGRPGGGPGEYRRIWRITTSNDGVVVTDDFAARHTLLTREFTFVRTIPATGGVPLSLVAGDSGRVLESAGVRRGAHAGYALFFRDMNGTIRSRASAVRVRQRDDGRDPASRALSLSPDGALAWAAHRDEYLLERCSFRTATCAVLSRSVEWFPPRRELAASFDERMARFPPSPELLGVAQEGERRLWVMSLVADERWRRGMVLGGAHPGVSDPHRYWDTVIEAIDLSQFAVVARRRVDEALLWGPLVGGYTALYTEDADGVPRILVLRLALRD